jgi:hypothetical protein
MRSADARNRQIGGPEGIAKGFQVSAYSGEPFNGSLARNLFSKQRCRFMLVDELEPVGPQMAGVFDAPVLASDTEWLTRARAGPHGLVLGPSGELKRKGPTADPGEEVGRFGLDMGKAFNGRGNDRALGQVTGANQAAEPSASEGVCFIVEIHFD